MPRTTRRETPIASCPPRDARTIPRGAAVLALAALTVACAPRTGDLGRPEASPLAEAVLPFVGNAAARARGEPVSRAMLTDRERELRRRSYRFVMPVHRRDFFARGQAAAVRARIWPDAFYDPDPTAYHRLARKDGHLSETSRYAALRAEIDADLALIGPFYEVVRQVYAADRRRLEDLDRTVALTAEEEADALARVYENRRVVAWAKAALGWRLEAYGYSLQRLRIEVPSEHAEAVDYDLTRLAAEVDAFAEAVAALEYDPGPVIAKR